MFPLSTSETSTCITFPASNQSVFVFVIGKKRRKKKPKKKKNPNQFNNNFLKLYSYNLVLNIYSLVDNNLSQWKSTCTNIYVNTYLPPYNYWLFKALPKLYITTLFDIKKNKILLRSQINLIKLTCISIKI